MPERKLIDVPAISRASWVPANIYTQISQGFKPRPASPTGKIHIFKFIKPTLINHVLPDLWPPHLIPSSKDLWPPQKSPTEIHHQHVLREDLPNMNACSIFWRALYIYCLLIPIIRMEIPCSDIKCTLNWQGRPSSSESI